MPTIMISYARKDARDFAQKLYDSLTANGIPTWLDTTNIEGGAQWLRELEKGLDSADTVLAIRTPAARDSMWVRNERLYALNARKRIIPILLKNCPDDLELIGHQPIDFRTDFDPAFNDLLKLLHTDPTQTTDRRTLERAYLGKILLEHSIWQEVYTPMAGVGHLRKNRSNPNKLPIRTTNTRIEQKFQRRLREHMTDRHPPITQQHEYDDILPAIHDMRQLVILGDPGSGKTTTLWRIAADYAQNALDDETLPLPIFIRLGELGTSPDLQTYIHTQLGDLAPHYDDLLTEKRLAFLLDGLNELSAARRDHYLPDLKTLIDDCQSNDLIAAITCRELDYTKTLDMGIPERLIITPLDPVRIYNFIHTYITDPPDAAKNLFWELAGDEAKQQWEEFSQDVDEPFDVFWLANELPSGKRWDWGLDHEEYINSYWKRWLRQRYQPRSMLQLSTNPFMLYMMTQVYTEEGHLPPNRGALFALFMDFLLIDREKLKETEASQVQRRLADLGYEMQKQGEGTTFEKTHALDYLHDDLTLYRALSASILTGTDEIRFTHQLLQEYFAAKRLDRDMQNGIPATQFFPPQNWWQPTGWEETAILLAGLYFNDCTPVINWLKTAQPELTARCILDSGSQISETTYASLRETWLPRLTDLTSDPKPPARAALGRALGSLDTDTARHQRSRPVLDNRPGLGLRDDGLPDIAWCEVPAGPFLMGSDRQKDDLAYSDEPDLHQLTLSAFYIARYPVTYAQYAAFVASDGYTNPAYWTDAGWDWKSPKLNPEYAWNDPRWHIANHPVVGVTWYEAYAFTQWLSARLGYAVRLTTESEWEKAARGTDGRIYPYGNDFDPAKANVSATNINRTSPVGIFPDGGTPYPQPAYDMSGNVFEWCQSVYNNPYRFPENNTKDGTDVRVLRGGSWGFNHNFSRAAFRSWFSPFDRSSLRRFSLCPLLLALYTVFCLLVSERRRRESIF